MKQPAAASLDTRSAYVSADFQNDFDLADCALDEQLEQLQRQYASAIRAAERARFELELLERRTDIHPHMVAQAARQHAAAETRSARLMRAIDVLEERLEKE